MLAARSPGAVRAVVSCCLRFCRDVPLPRAAAEEPEDESDEGDEGDATDNAAGDGTYGERGATVGSAVVCGGG